MKKLILLVVMALCASLTFAKDGKSFLDFGLSVPFTFENSGDGALKKLGTQYQTNSVAVSLNGRRMFTDLIGFFANIDGMLPMEVSTKTKANKDDPVKFSVADFDILFGLNLLLGPTFMPLRTEKFALSLSPGVGCLMLCTDGSKSIFAKNTIALELGLDTKFEYYVTQKFYLAAALQMCLGLAIPPSNITLGNDSIVSITYDNFGSTSFTVEPKILMGFRW